MRYSLQCNVNGKVMIGKTIEVTKGTKSYVLLPNEKGLLSSIKIVAKAPNPEKFVSRIESGDAGVAATITIHGDHALHEELIQEFQELESVLSFKTDGILRSIGWDVPEQEFLPETEEEKAQISILSCHVEKAYRESPIKLDQKTFERIVQSKNNYSSLIVPKAFFREGINNFHSRRYINAFYNFYFVLEDFYGKGKMKNRDIANAFKDSMAFKKFLELIMEKHLDANKRHWENIRKLCAEENVAYNTDGLIDLLLRVRGNLHHYSSKSSKHLGSPFNHDDFESIAFLAMGLAVLSITQRILEINQSLGIA